MAVVQPPFQLVDSPTAFRKAADALRRGRGPFAIDTERASSFRYDDRAFLVQVFRRDAGIFLIAPEGHRDAVTKIFAPVLNGQDWIVHAAGEDLPCLAWLGLYPGTLFDTELAGRIGGFPRPNLAAMVAEFCGVQLEKGHGREDWSLSPLPHDWLEYAALDVAYLNDLAEAQAEFLDQQHKLDIAEAEFAYIVEKHADITAPPVRSWRDTKGINSLRSRESLQLARTLWHAREQSALDTDTAPGKLMSTKTLVAVSKERPQSRKELQQIRGVRRANRTWEIVRSALDSDPQSFPPVLREHTLPPGKGYWEREYPDSWAILQEIRTDIALVSEDITIPAENILSPRVLRSAVWQVTTESGRWTTHRVAQLLDGLGARDWQITLCAPLIAAHAQ